MDTPSLTATHWPLDRIYTEWLFNDLWGHPTDALLVMAGRIDHQLDALVTAGKMLTDDGVHYATLEKIRLDIETILTIRSGCDD
ncbi:hypothetical protein [Arsenicibacter rosenii]|uniref:Uncharacterized protein n=1 Tax=Arsenicibacter rosenii TaxID=1750698 RepID=A0A1S2VLZ2_9BACT|nr:hypothetical protein [Arsenicibacter rosenii]OIN59773.1 hypothetical protein BLX24_07915 [Arsenicibacter rosenii]